MREHAFRRTLQTNGVRYEETDINYRARTELGNHFGFRARRGKRLRSAFALHAGAAQPSGIRDQPYQPHACARAGTDGSIWGQLADTPRSEAHFRRSESRQLGIPEWPLQLVPLARSNRAHSQRTAQCGIAIAVPSARLLSLGLIGTND